MDMPPNSHTPPVAPLNRHFYFFVGTVAELIKIMPVMHRLQERSIPFSIISSGQNNLEGERLFEIAGLPPVAIYLTKTPVRKSVLGLLTWFITTFATGFRPLRTYIRQNGSDGIMVVHGDTLSTVMGAVMGKLFGLRVAHVEAGLRSHNFLQPFPEELDRYIAAFFADYHFAPSEDAVVNLSARRGTKVNTHFNTNIDSLEFVRSLETSVPILVELGSEPFWIFIMHRQENLLNPALVRKVVSEVLEAANTMKCVFVAHEPTRAALTENGLWESLVAHPNIVVCPRMPYPEFMTLLQASQYIITDGGGNQQECYYLGKPCLLLRNLTEGGEGLGGNVVISRNDPALIRDFIQNHARYQRPEVRPDVPPSEIVVKTLTGV